LGRSQGREVGKGGIGPFVGVRWFDWVGFWVPSDRKGVAQCRRIKAQVNAGLDGKDTNLRHLKFCVVGIRR